MTLLMDLILESLRIKNTSAWILVVAYPAGFEPLVNRPYMTACLADVDFVDFVCQVQQDSDGQFQYCCWRKGDGQRATD